MGRAVTASTRRELLTSADLVYEVWRAMHGDIYEEHITGTRDRVRLLPRLSCSHCNGTNAARS